MIVWLFIRVLSVVLWECLGELLVNLEISCGLLFMFFWFFKFCWVVIGFCMMGFFGIICEVMCVMCVGIECMVCFYEFFFVLCFVFDLVVVGGFWVVWRVLRLVFMFLILKMVFRVFKLVWGFSVSFLVVMGNLLLCFWSLFFIFFGIDGMVFCLIVCVVWVFSGLVVEWWVLFRSFWSLLGFWGLVLMFKVDLLDFDDLVLIGVGIDLGDVGLWLWDWRFLIGVRESGVLEFFVLLRLFFGVRLLVEWFDCLVDFGLGDGFGFLWWVFFGGIGGGGVFFGGVMI